MRFKVVLPILLAVLLPAGAACTRPPDETRASSHMSAAITPAPTTPLDRSPSAMPTDRPLPAGSQGQEPSPSSEFCSLSAPLTLLGKLRTALITRDGELLAALVDQDHGMDIQMVRGGRIINYDKPHAQHVFSSDFAPDWGPGAGSGLPVVGSFRDLVAPALLEVLSRNYSLDCDRIRIGGATYEPTWPYGSIHFYSAFFPGTEANGGLDWRTWLFGMRIANAEPYLYAILQLRWEP